MRLILLLNTILIFSTSCSIKNDVEFPYNAEREFSVDDYQKHLKQLAVNFIKNNKGYVYKVSYRTNKYLSKISNRIISNNESLFDKRKLNVYWIKDSRPIFFSLPGGYIFLSKGLLKSYVRSEDVFVSIIAYEILKSNLLIYKKNIVTPFEDISLDKVLLLSQVDIETMNKMNILTYEVLKRAGFDPESRLLWIQLQNKNSIDFALLYETPSILPKLEYMFKNYVSTRRDNLLEYERSASRDFYKFRKRIISF